MKPFRAFFVFRRLMPVFILCMVLVPVSLVSAETTSSADRIVSEMEKKYAGKSFEADFSQVSTLSALDIEESAKGHAAFSHPGKMYWEYDAPEQHEIITNGTTLWIYRPLENQVMISDARSFFKSGSGGAFLSDISLVRKYYDIREGTHLARHYVLELTNRNPGAEIASISILLTREDYLIEKVTTRNPYGDLTEFHFSNIRFREIKPDLFEFTPPQGVDIMEMNE